MDSRQTIPENPFSIVHTVLDSGKRLPFLVASDVWIPTRIATRWAVRYRRYRVQAATLADNLHIIARQCHIRKACKHLNHLSLE